MEVYPTLLAHGGGHYPCFKCNNGTVYLDGSDGVCRTCGETCLNHMENANTSLTIVYRL